MLLKFVEVQMHGSVSGFFFLPFVESISAAVVLEDVLADVEVQLWVEAVDCSIRSLDVCIVRLFACGAVQVRSVGIFPGGWVEGNIRILRRDYSSYVVCDCAEFVLAFGGLMRFYHDTVTLWLQICMLIDWEHMISQIWSLWPWLLCYLFLSLDS